MPSFGAMCTARVGSDAGHDVGPGGTAARAQRMQRPSRRCKPTGVSIWTRILFFGLSRAIAMGIPVRLRRLSLARTYSVAEIDVLAFASSNAEEFEMVGNFDIVFYRFRAFPSSLPTTPPTRRVPCLPPPNACVYGILIGACNLMSHVLALLFIISQIKP